MHLTQILSHTMLDEIYLIYAHFRLIHAMQADRIWRHPNMGPAGAVACMHMLVHWIFSTSTHNELQNKPGSIPHTR